MMPNSSPEMAFHPGEFIREELEARNWAQRDLAYVLKVPEQSINLLLSGKRGITVEMARALGDAFDVSPELFINLQAAYDLARAKAPDPAVARRARLQSAFPVREMIKRGWFSDSDAIGLEEQATRFFRVPKIEDLSLAFAAKRSNAGSASPAQIAWVCRVRQLGESIASPNYSVKKLREALNALHALMAAAEETRRVPRILTEAGVRFVVVEALPGSKIDGVCTWSGDAPIIGMSLRFDRIDNFWFVLRHEIEHVLRQHGRTEPVIDSELDGDFGGLGPEVPGDERLANLAASDFCVPAGDLDSFIARKKPYFSEQDLLGFAGRLGVHPGVVAGQFRRKTGNWKIFSKHLVKIRSFVTSSALSDGWGDVAPVSL